MISFNYFTPQIDRTVVKRLTLQSPPDLQLIAACVMGT